MMKKWLKRGVIIASITAAAVGIGLSLRPDPVTVDIEKVTRGRLTVTVSGAGRFRVVDSHKILVPVAGNLEAIALRPGDPVRQGDIVARIHPASPPLLDARSRTVLKKRIKAARLAAAEVRQNVRRIREQLALQKKSAKRLRTLADSGAVARQTLDEAFTAKETAEAQLAAAKLEVARGKQDLAALLARLGDGRHGADAEAPKSLQIGAPAAGVVLRVMRDDEGTVGAGTPLLELGNPERLELVVDLPTQFAVRVSPGDSVTIDGMGNGVRYSGVVRLVETSGFTKVTALGVEEQRANVIIDPAPPTPRWRAVSDGYAARAHVAVYRKDGVLKAPSAAVFKDGEAPAVFVVERATARLARVETGRMGDRAVAILSGLRDGASVVVHPSDDVADGAAVVAAKRRGR